MAANGPTRLRDDGVFILNDFTLIVDVTDEVVIAAPVTAVVLFNGVPQPTIIVNPIVAGGTITTTMTTEQLALLPAKKATLNLLFDGEYVIQQPLTPTTDGSVPATVTFTYSDSTLGVFRVSFYHGATQAALTEADRIACEAARNYIDDAMTQVNDRVPGFLDDLSDTILAGHDATYTSLAGGATGGLSASAGANGTTIDATNRNFQMTSDTSGANSYMRRDFDLLSTESLRVNDKINVRCVVNQSVDGAISDSVIGIRLFTSTGVAVAVNPVAPSLYDPATKSFTLDGQFTVTNTATTYYIEVFIKSGAPNQPSAVNLRWLDFGINQDKYLYEDAITLINEAVRGYQQIAVTFDDQPVVTKIDLTGVSDVTAALQAEFDLAVSTSGKWRGRVGTPRTSATINVSGRLDADFGGMDINVAIPGFIAPAAGSEAFFINTASPVFFRNVTTRRLNSNPTHSPTFCRFNPIYINAGSIFERVFTWNMPRSIIVDYCDGLEVLACDFGGGEFQGLRAGILAPASLTNLKVRRCNFQSYLNTQCQIGNLTGLVFEQNTLKTTSAVTFPNRALELITQTGSGTNSGARIMNNKFGSYREYGLLLSTVAGTSINDIQIYGNFFDDRTPDATDNSSRGIHIAGIAKNISMIDIMFNHIYCKEIGLRMDQMTLARIQNNTFEKSNVGGAYATSQAMTGSNLDFYSSGNYVSPALGVATNKATWGTEYTTAIM